MHIESVVYWLFSSNMTVSDILTQGYIGITNNPNRRRHEHKRNTERFPEHDFRIIFQGTRVECLLIEEMLRPTKGIGWNSAPGGKNGIGYGWVCLKPRTSPMKGKHHTEEAKAKLRAANLGKPCPESKKEKLRGRPSWNAGTGGTGIMKAWNKGKTGIYSDETRAKISQGLKDYYENKRKTELET